METDGRVLDASALIDRAKIGPFQVGVAFLSALLLFVEGFDTQVIGFITPRIAEEWHLSRGVLGWVLSADKFGLLAGYVLLAPLSGRFGQKPVVVVCTTFFGALTFLTSTAQNTPELMFFRFLTGVGLGGALPSAVALTGEYFPKVWRASSITMIYCGLSLGQLTAGGTAAALSADFGWRAVLWVGGALPLLAALLLFFALPESVEHLINRAGKPAAALAILRRIAPEAVVQSPALVAGGATKKVRVRHLFQQGRTTGTVVLWIGVGLNLLVVFVLQTWLTQILIDVGLRYETATMAAAMFNAGGIVAAFTVGPLMDRLGPYVVMTSLFVAGGLVITTLGASLSTAAPVLIGGITLFCGLCTSGIQKGANALAVYFYPTELRATGIGGALGIGRIGAIIGPILVGYLLSFGWRPATLLYGATGVMLVGACAMAVMNRTYGHGRAAAKPAAVSAE